MLDAILSLIPGGQLTVILGAIAGALLAVFGIHRSGVKAGVDRQKAKEAAENEKLLEAVRRSHDARERARRDGVPDSDPYNRDNR